METVWSLDIFDTIVVRDVYKPTDLFYFVGKALQKSGVLKINPLDFQNFRIEAERLARIKSIHEEITLDEIYNVLSTILNLDKNLAEILKEKEIQLEKESIVPILENLEKISEKTILVSDTYFDKRTIIEFLRNIGVTTYKEIYVSSEHRKTKHSGRLYEIISRKYHIEEHIGDNKRADFEVPRRMGISAKLYEKSQPSRYERAIYHNEKLPYELRCILAGTMKAARLSKYYKNEHLQTIHEVSTNVIGPFLFFYVYWVLKKASELGLERLYFLAREGQILKSIADILIENFNTRVETRYLYVSRKALYLPSLKDNKDINEMLGYLKISTKFSNLREGLKELGFLEENHHYSINDLKNQVLKASEQKRAILLEYLKQEGFAENLKIGIVDIGWQGRLQLCLSKILDYGGLYNPVSGIAGFYLGLLSKRVPIYKSDKRLCFFSDEDMHSVLSGRMTRYVALYEIFMAATHGLTIGYKRDGEKIKPILKSEENVELLKWGLKIQQDSIKHFVNLFVKNVIKYDLKLSHLQYISKILLSLFLKSPTKMEAITYGRAVHRSDVEENEPRYIAPFCKPSDIIRSLLQIRSKKILMPKINPLWIEGSLFISLPNPLAKLFLVLLDLRKKCTNTFKSRFKLMKRSS